MSADREQAAIYRARARDYHRLVMAEDCDANLAPELTRRVPLSGARVVEVGAGTGRVTKLLLEAGADVHAFEREPAMLEVAREHAPGARFEVADARALPLADGVADVVVAGWVFGHLRLWMQDGWREEVGRALDEAARVLVPGGAIVILETLGTGTTTPAPPSDALAEYYAFLEERGFERSAVATDYAFDGAEEAAHVLGAFFGDAMRERILRERWARVPEHTGVWVLAPR